MNLIKLVFLGFFLVVSHPVFATSWYQVEVVVFDRLYPDLDGEKWRSEEYQIRNNLVELQAADSVLAADELVPFMVLPSGKNRLSGVNYVFKKSSDYRSLYHLSWQQPALERRQSRYVHILKLDGDQTIPVADTTEPDEEPAFIESFIQPDRIIDGSIRIRSGYYLHVDVDLYYFKQLAPEDKIIRTSEELTQANFEKTVINLRETRKIKLNEIHYFDHPMFGVIIQVTRL